MRVSIVFLLIILGGILMNCSLSDPLTGGAIAPVPEKVNGTLQNSDSNFAVSSSFVSARVFVNPMPSQ